MTRDLPPLKSAKNRRQTFPPSNPAGGGFHACDYGSRFMDCCAFESRVKACDTSILKPASFLKKEYADIPGALCPRGSLWYKCPGTTPLFVGCCRTNPCLQNGCPSKDLMAATLVSSSQKAWPYISTLNPRFAQYTRSLPVPSALLPTRSLSSPNLPTTTGTTQPSGSESPNYQTRIKVDTIGGAIGGVVGGVLVGIFIGTIFLVHRYRKASKRPSSASISSGIQLFSPLDISFGLTDTFQTFPTSLLI